MKKLFVVLIFVFVLAGQSLADQCFVPRVIPERLEANDQNGRLLYVGIAPQDSSTSNPVWWIRKRAYDVNGNYLGYYSPGCQSYNATHAKQGSWVWDNRETYDYPSSCFTEKKQPFTCVPSTCPITKTDKLPDGHTEYEGRAIGIYTPTSEAAWSIKKLVYDGDTLIGYQTANCTAGYSFVWDDRETYSYGYDPE